VCIEDRESEILVFPCVLEKLYSVADGVGHIQIQPQEHSLLLFPKTLVICGT
jgi:hypothetical protein